MVDDVRAWSLLRDSAILKVEGSAVTIALACGGTIDARVTNPQVEGALPLVIRSALALPRGVTVWCKGGKLEYTGAIEIDLSDLRDRWQTWLGSRTLEMHAAVRAALRDPDVGALVERWRKDRTSDLADAIEAIERAVPSDLGREIGAILQRAEELLVTYLVDIDDPAVAAGWKELTARVASFSDRDPDPRIGRGLVRVFGVPSNHFFRADQVRHAVEKFEQTSDDPSFADFGLLLVERHADAGTAEQLDELASRLRIEADCNAAELADRLEQIADRTHARYPRDRRLEKPLAAALAGLHG